MLFIASMKTLTIIGTPTIWVNHDVRSPVTSGGWLVCLWVIPIYIHISLLLEFPIFCVSVPDLLFKPQLLILIPFNILTSGRQTHPFKYPKIESEIGHILRAKGFLSFYPMFGKRWFPILTDMFNGVVIAHQLWLNKY